MPKVEDIERFKLTLNSLGNEPEVLRETGEEIEEPPLEAEDFLSDLGELLGETAVEEEEKIPEEKTQEKPPEEEPTEEKPPEEEPAGIPESELPELDLDSLFGEEAAVEQPAEGGEEEFEMPVFSEAEETGEMSKTEETERGVEAESEVGLEAGYGEEKNLDEEIESIDQLEIPEDFTFEEGEESEEGGFESPPGETETKEKEEIEAKETVGGEEEFKFEETELEEEIGEGEEEFVLDEFALPEFGEEETEKVIPKEEAFVPIEEVVTEEEVGEEEIRLTDEEFDILKKTLSILPINLKLRIEELIANEEIKGKNLKGLIDLLKGGASPQEIALYVSKVTGKRIRIPRTYEKKAGVAFERERKTFAYALKENILPIATSVFLSLIVIGLFSFLTYRFIYSPLHAINLYKKGYAQLESDRYGKANEYFEKAKKIWEMKPWYYKYADAFINKRQFILAEKKYDELLNSYPGDRKGILDYARLESKYMANYEKANELLKSLLDKNIYDYDALLAQGDNYLEWAAEDPSKYEKARFAYASILDKYGEKREVLFRMLKYFIRTNQFNEARTLFLALNEDKKGKVDAETYAELAGYFIDRGKLGLVSDILNQAMKADLLLPDIHYQFARYYRKIKEIGEERKALNYTIRLLEEKKPLSPKFLKMLIDSYDRLGELYYSNREVITAEKYFRKALILLENAVNTKLLKPQKLFGRVYEHLGNIAYYVENNLDNALILFTRAKENGLDSIELDYKIGYLHYMKKDYRSALLELAKVITERPDSWNPLFAMANTLYFRGDYQAAEGYYLQLLEKLEAKRESIRFIRIEDNPEHRALIEYMLRVYNNIGVDMLKLSERTGDRKKFSRALVDLTRASEFYDILTRNPVTMERTKTKNLAFLNMNGILHPQSGFEPQIYWRIQKDPERVVF